MGNVRFFILSQQHGVAIAMKRAAIYRDLPAGLYARIEDMKAVHGKPVTGDVFDLHANALAFSSADRDFRDFHFLGVAAIPAGGCRFGFVDVHFV
jgi:hypothetical protein